jgi:hypothetical protein
MHRPSPLEEAKTVQFRRRISKRIRRAAQGTDLAADINADVSVNASENTRRRTSPRPAGGGTQRESEERRPNE